jgi:hypothetical protein
MKGGSKPLLMTVTWVFMMVFQLIPLNFFPWNDHSRILKTIQTAGATEPQGYEVYSNQEFGISLKKPKQWEVFILNSTILIKPSYNSTISVFLIPILRVHPNMQALSFIHFVCEQARMQMPDLRIGEKRVNKKNTVAEVTASHTHQGTKETMRGFYLVSIDEGRGMFCGYEAPRDKFEDNHPTLRTVLASLKLTPFQFYNATKSEPLHTSAHSSAGKETTPTIDTKQLTMKLSSDRTMYLAVPSDWTVGGGNVSLIATPPDQKMGITATNDAQPATFDPYGYLMNKLFPFYQCTGTVIHKREPNEELMRFSRSQGYSSKAENFIGETTQRGRQKIIFWMMVNAATLPAGGFVSTVGFYAVPELFERNSGVLYAISASMGPNQQEIMGRLNENLKRLGQASKTMAETTDVVIRGLRSHTANWDRALDKYNYYLSGEHARYSPSENRIYVVDSNLQTYAGNPNYPQEMLTEVPDHLWSKLSHERGHR